MKPHFENKLFRIWLYLITIFLPIYLLAQEQRAETILPGDTIRVIGEKQEFLPKESSIVSRMPLQIHKIPVSVGLIPQQIIDSPGATKLSDVLTNVSGISVQSSYGIHDYFFIRGFESTKAGLVLIDGADEPDNSYFTFYGYGFYDMYNLERVEILKGPSAFLYGANTLSGAVNLIRKQPGDKNFFNSTFSIGQYNTIRGTVDFNTRRSAQNMAFRLNGLWNQSDEFRQEKGYQKFALNPALSWKKSKDNIRLNLEYIDTYHKPDVGIPLKTNFRGELELADIPRKWNYQSKQDILDQKQWRIRLDYSRIQNAALSLHSKFYFSGLEADFRLSTLDLAVADADSNYLVGRHLWQFDDRQRYLGNQTEGIYTVQWWITENHILLGWEAFRGTARLISCDDPLNSLELFKRIEFPPDSRYNYPARNIWKPDRRSLAPYILMHSSFLSKVDLLIGARYDFVRNSDSLITDLRVIGINRIYHDCFKKNYAELSPLIGLTFHESENLSFYANFGRAFGQPVGAVFDPEKSTQYEAGYKYQSVNGKLINTMSIYSLKKYNVRVLSSQGLDENSGAQQSVGLEFDLAAELAKDLMMIFNYTYNDAELQKYNVSGGMGIIKDYSGQRPVYVPMQMFNLWLQKLFYQRLRTNIKLAYVGERYINLDNNFSLNSYFLFDISASYSFDHLTLGFVLKNLTNTRWEQQGFGYDSVLPGSPRLAQIYLSYER